MNAEKYIEIEYHCGKESMERRTIIPSELSMIIFEDKVYSLQTLRGAAVISKFGDRSDIIRDSYDRYWYHRVMEDGGVHYETYEPLPAYIVSEEYEAKRIPDMMIFPFIKITRNGELFEFHENYARWRDDEKFKEDFIALNRSVLERHHIYYKYYPGVSVLL